MTDADRVQTLAFALDAARRSYLALPMGCKLPDDVALARSQAYRALLRAGQEIRRLSNRASFIRMQQQLFTDDPALSAKAATDLQHLWAGLIDWPDSAGVAARLH